MAGADRVHAILSYVRLVLVGVAAVLAWQAFVSHRVSAVWPLLPAAGFAVIAIVPVDDSHSMRWQMGIARDPNSPRIFGAISSPARSAASMIASIQPAH